MFCNAPSAHKTDIEPQQVDRGKNAKHVFSVMHFAFFFAICMFCRSTSKLHWELLEGYPGGSDQTRSLLAYQVVGLCAAVSYRIIPSDWLNNGGGVHIVPFL